jgi:IS5 family transposase
LIAAAARPRRQTIIEHQSDADIDANTSTSTSTNANTNGKVSELAGEALATTTIATTVAAAAATTAANTTPTVSEAQSVDPDATWLKKGAKSHFGFRTYVTVDTGDGYVRGVHTAPANQSETTHFEAAVKSADFKPKRTYADKGFASAANRAHLRGCAIKSAIMHKAQRNKPLTQRQKNANKRISKTRYIVEQCFGTMKRLFGMARASYLGTAKVNAQFTIKAMCMNLLKAANKICLLNGPVGVVRPQ